MDPRKEYEVGEAKVGRMNQGKEKKDSNRVNRRESAEARGIHEPCFVFPLVPSMQFCGPLPSDTSQNQGQSSSAVLLSCQGGGKGKTWRPSAIPLPTTEFLRYIRKAHLEKHTDSNPF